MVHNADSFSIGYLLALIGLMHRTSQKDHSAKFACKVFSEVGTVFSYPPWG
jgi:hypothetical protein